MLTKTINQYGKLLPHELYNYNQKLVPGFKTFGKL